MTSRDDFTPVEWALLTELPVRIVAASVQAEPTGEISTIKELVTGLTSLSEGAAVSRDNALLQAVFDAYKQDGLGEQQALELSEQGIARLIPDTIERCRQVSEILAAKAEPDEAEEFKRWLYSTAERIASAASTGGFLGIGGQRISDAEADFLAQLAEALGIE
ncbi:MAG TPA: hypothetical protein VIL01_11715 [Thermomicrobiales bacterium]